MKCEVCLELLEEYLDGELPRQEGAQLGEHLSACADCSASFAELTAQQELFAHYDREIEVPPFLWTRIAAHTVDESKGARNGWYRRVMAIFASPVASAPPTRNPIWCASRRPVSRRLPPRASPTAAP